MSRRAAIRFAVSALAAVTLLVPLPSGAAKPRTGAGDTYQGFPSRIERRGHRGYGHDTQRPQRSRQRHHRQHFRNDAGAAASGSGATRSRRGTQPDHAHGGTRRSPGLRHGNGRLGD